MLFENVHQLLLADCEERIHRLGRGARTRVRGVQLLEKLDELFENAFTGPKMKPYEFQRKLLGKFLHHIAPQLLGDDWIQDMQRVITERDWHSFKSGVISLCPRQLGKTWLVSYFVACVALLQATTVTDEVDHHTVVFSLQRSQGVVVLNYVRAFFANTRVGGWRYVMNNMTDGIAILGVGGIARIRITAKPEPVKSPPSPTFLSRTSTPSRSENHERAKNRKCASRAHTNTRHTSTCCPSGFKHTHTPITATRVAQPREIPQ